MSIVRLLIVELFIFLNTLLWPPSPRETISARYRNPAARIMRKYQSARDLQ